MKTIEARAIISAKDVTGGAFAAIASKITRLQATAKAASSRVSAAAARSDSIGRTGAVSSKATSAARAVGGVGAGMIGVPGLGAVGAAALAVKAQKRFAETDMALTRVGITADATDKQISDLDQTVRKTAFDTGNSFDKVTKGLESLVAGGLDLDKALPAIPAIAKTAQAAGAEVEDMATTTLALNQALGIGTDKMQGAFDVLVTGGKAGKFELKDMARYMASILPAAKAVGMQGQEGLEKIVALMQTVRAGTGTTEEAASSISNIFAKMESEETAKKFTKFGVDLRGEMKKARAEGKDLLETFVDLTKTATKGDLSKIPQLFTDMEFARGMRALMQYGDVYTDVMGRVKNATGSTMADFERVMQRPQMAINRLSEGWDRMLTGGGKLLDRLGTSKAMDWIGRDFEKTSEEGVKPPWALGPDRDPRKERIATAIAQSREMLLKGEEAARRNGGPGLLPHMRREPLAAGEVDKRMQSPELQALRQRIFELEQARDVPDAQDRSLFSDNEVQSFKDEAERQKAAQDFLDRGGMPRPSREEMARKRVSAKMGWDRSAPSNGSAGENNILDLPYQGGGEPDRRAAAQAVTVTGEMKGDATIKVVIEAPQVIQAIADAKSVTAEMRGMMKSGNGPGSTGRSSPDAAAPTGASGSW